MPDEHLQQGLYRGAASVLKRPRLNLRRDQPMVDQGQAGKAMTEHDVRNAFWRNQDGSWICIDPVTIEHPQGRMQVSPGTTITPGVPFMGIDLAAWLDQQLRNSNPDL